jgi:hypothetical protein
MKKTLLLSFFLLAQLAFGQDTYHYRRPLKGIEDQWHRISLPDALYGKLKNPFTDLRILGLTPDGDTVEAPYLLEVAKSKEIMTMISNASLNPVERNGYYYFTLYATEHDVINRIDLKFNNANFSWPILLEGSQNQDDWYTVLRDYQILSIREGYADYAFTSLYFPDCSFRYYRIGIPADQIPELRQAGLWHQEREAGVVKNYTPKHMEVRQKGKQTIVDLEFEYAVPIDWLEARIKTDFDYYRPCAVYYHQGESLPEREGLRSYTRAASDVLCSAKLSGIGWEDPHIAKYWRLVVDNFDNEALDFDSVRCSGPEHSLVARFTSKADYFLYYGRDRMEAPIYDLSYFTDKIPEELKRLVPGAEEALILPEIPEEPFLKSRWWLWSLIALVVLMLGGFTLRMLKSSRLEE